MNPLRALKLSMTARGTETTRKRQERRMQPTVLALEDRKLLSTFTVDRLGPDDASVAGTLRWAITQANQAADDSVILFSPVVFGTPQTIKLGGTELLLSNKVGTETIEGPVEGVTISGEGKSRVFEVSAGATATLSKVNIIGGRAAGVGGGLLNRGLVNLLDCQISANTVDLEPGPQSQGGGGLCNIGDTDKPAGITLVHCAITDNVAGGSGGGLLTFGTNSAVSLTNCTVSRNQSTSRDGGGIDNVNGVAFVANSTLSANSARLGGGLINGGITNLTNCTLSGNTAREGGGVWSVFETCALLNCTVSGNKAELRGGGLVGNGGPEDSPLVLTDTIVAANTAGARPSDIQMEGQTTARGKSNLIGIGGSGGLSFLTNFELRSLSDLRLAPLGFYGGLTQTMAVLPGSAAIGKGRVSGAITDQRGVSRTLGKIDIGAFQDRGFTMAAIAGTPQSQKLGKEFATPLTVVVTSQFGDPVAGGLILFAAPETGPSARLNEARATIDATHHASVKATANFHLGTYEVSALGIGVKNSARFQLTNVR